MPTDAAVDVDCSWVSESASRSWLLAGSDIHPIITRIGSLLTPDICGVGNDKTSEPQLRLRSHERNKCLSFDEIVGRQLDLTRSYSVFEISCVDDSTDGATRWCSSQLGDASR